MFIQLRKKVFDNAYCDINNQALIVYNPYSERDSLTDSVTLLHKLRTLLNG